MTQPDLVFYGGCALCLAEGYGECRGHSPQSDPMNPRVPNPPGFGLGQAAAIFAGVGLIPPMGFVLGPVGFGCGMLSRAATQRAGLPTRSSATFGIWAGALEFVLPMLVLMVALVLATA